MQSGAIFAGIFLLEACEALVYQRKASCDFCKISEVAITIGAGHFQFAGCLIKHTLQFQAADSDKQASSLRKQSALCKQQAAALTSPSEFSQSSKLQRKALAFEKAADRVTTEQVSN